MYWGRTAIFAIAILGASLVSADELRLRQGALPASGASSVDPVSYCGDDCQVCGRQVAGCAATSPCGCPVCQAKAAGQPNPCADSHKGVFYANDFSYLNDPNYHGCCFGDCLKLMPVDPCGRWGTVDVGGQLRLRYHHEKGMGQEAGATRFQDTENDFLLTRLRLYTNWNISESVRFYIEGIYADASGSDDYIPRPIDENFGDFLNLFVDLKVADGTTVRVGRQELLYGNQRTVSPLDWANTRRTFEGVRVLHQEGDWAIDGFYTNLVPADANDLDEADYDQSFYGVYGVYSGLENATIDFYYLGYDDQSSYSTAPGIAALGTQDFSLHTIGLRLNGSHGDWLYEFEGAPQFGRQSGLALDHDAGFATAGIGRKLDMAWSPTVWFYYDYASGNNLGGDFNRYNQLFPLAHKYLGFIDATQRSNIESPNVLLTMKPHQKIELLLWYYHFMANQDTDIVPSIGGTPTQRTNSKDWGDEVDVTAKYVFGPRSNVLFGYSHFWAGNKIIPPGGAVDADFFYTQWELNF
jgi:hypothetical protein